MVVVDELEKKAIEELKKGVEQIDGRTFGCWGWSVRIYRNPKSLTPPKTEETVKLGNTSEVRSVPVSV